MANTFPTTVVDLFDTWASKAPTRLAAEWQGETLTYALLRTASLHVSQALLAAGVKPRDKVPLLTQMSLEMLPAVIGILRVGACYAPLDVAVWSSARVEAALAELAAPVALITTGSAGLTLHGVRVTVGFQKEWLRLPLQQGAGDLHLYDRLDEIRRHLHGDDLAWVIFTSGTTGKPKGVMIYHSAIHALTKLNVGEDIEAAAQRGIRCLLAFSVAFDGCAGVVWTTLTKGGTLAMASPVSFPEVAATCDLLHLTPSMLAILDPAGPYEGVRYIFLGAEAPKLQVVRQWIKPGRKVFTTYGPSETTCIISLGELKPDEEPPFGDLLPGVRVVLVDEDLAECDYGEVMIAGPGLAAGYLNNPNLTATKFLTWHGQRFYRTGDLARRKSDGHLVWAGRADSLVKNRGFLINLETEVEPAMRSFPSVRLAVAIQWRGRLVGCVQPADVDSKALRAFMRERFDLFLVPDAILPMESFPLNVNGKTDRRALQTLLEERWPQKEEVGANGGDLSLYDALRMAFAVCLHVPFGELDWESSFARLGGNSLVAIRLSNVMKEHGYPASVVQILKLDTIALLEESLSRAGPADLGEGPEDDAAAVPATDVQKAMLSRSLKNPTLYALVGTAKYVGERVPTAQELHDACSKAAAAHSVFQTRIDLTAFTLSSHPRRLDWDDISVGEAEFESACIDVEGRAWQALDGLTPADFEVPYFRISCVSVPDRKAIAFITRVHHALADAFSSAIFLRDVERALSGEPVPPGPRFQDYARFMHRYKQANLSRATVCFKAMLDPLPAAWSLPLPARNMQPHARAFSLARLQSPAATTKSALDAAARRLRITPSTIVYAAWSLFLASLTSAEHVGFSVSLSGRTIPYPAAQDIVGPLMTRAPFAAAVAASKPVSEWLVAMHKTTLEILEFDGLMHSLPEEIMQDPRTKSTSVVCFLDVPRASSDWVYSDRQQHHYEMSWYVEQAREGGGLAAEFEVQASRIDLQWAESVRTVPGRILDGLVRGIEGVGTLVGNLLGEASVTQ